MTVKENLELGAFLRNDNQAVVYQCTKSKSAINLGTFSRKRARNLTSGTVMG